MKTQSFNHPVFSYLLNCVNEEMAKDYGKVTPGNDKEKLQFVIDTFKSEQGYNIKNMGEFKAFQGWLMGLPSVLNVDFEYYRILELAYEWGSIEKGLSEKAKDKREDLILDQWFSWITGKFFRLCRKHKINF